MIQNVLVPRNKAPTKTQHSGIHQFNPRKPNMWFQEFCMCRVIWLHVQLFHLCFEKQTVEKQSCLWSPTKVYPSSCSLVCANICHLMPTMNCMLINGSPYFISLFIQREEVYCHVAKSVPIIFKDAHQKSKKLQKLGCGALDFK